MFNEVAAGAGLEERHRPAPFDDSGSGSSGSVFAPLTLHHNSLSSPTEFRAVANAAAAEHHNKLIAAAAAAGYRGGDLSSADISSVENDVTDGRETDELDLFCDDSDSALLRRRELSLAGLGERTILF